MTLVALRHLDTLLALSSGDYAPFSGIGSRETPADVCRDMTLICSRLAARGFTLRSGGAPGADLACEAQVGPASKEIFLPWKGFNGSKSSLYPSSLSDAAIAAEAMRQAPSFDPSALLRFDGSAASPLELAVRALLIAKHFHPAWDRCSQAAQKLHSRNVPQILGRTLDKPVRFALCWTKDGRASGGTGQALRVAQHLNIPILNLHDALVRQRLLSAVA
jgi:hypothetical protein